MGYPVISIAGNRENRQLPNERLSQDRRSESMVERARSMARTPLTSLPWIRCLPNYWHCTRTSRRRSPGRLVWSTNRPAPRNARTSPRSAPAVGFCCNTTYGQNPDEKISVGTEILNPWISLLKIVEMYNHRERWESFAPWIVKRGRHDATGQSEILF